MGSVITAQLGRTRPSSADRERAAAALRRACVEDRLSNETFVRRLDVVYAARTRAELDDVLGDVTEPGPLRRLLLDTTSRLSRLSLELARAWRVPRTPRLVLPLREKVVLGRSPAADFVVADATVSGRHATLAYDTETESWILEDAGSLNGTFVNGWRVVGPVAVRPGDELAMGVTRFVLAPPIA